MGAADFAAAAAQLRVQDAAGNWWQIDPPTGDWLCWDGTSWTRPPAVPAAGAPAAGMPAPAFPAAPSPATHAAVPRGRQIFFDIIMMAGSCGLAGAWYWYSGMAETQPDRKSCTAMVVLPLLLIVLRGPIDRLLMPLQKFRASIPRMALLGFGLAIPLLVANVLYARGYSQFDYLFRTYIISTLLSYVVLRTPSAPAPR